MVRPDRRAMLIEAAAELFTERAFDEVTTTEIAKRAGVAYGLIAHHFGNKRGLYLATLRAAADRLRAVHEVVPRGDTPGAQLRDALDRHIAFMEANAAGFLAVTRGGNGSDPEVRGIVEDLRWQGARRLLDALGAAAPVRPVLRTTMRGWVGYLDEIVIDHLRHRDVPRERLVSLAAATLAAALRAAAAEDPETGLGSAVLDLLDGEDGAQPAGADPHGRFGARGTRAPA
ncbi:TetR/AcrR family transcriptional regulator [Actinomadura darangshiensis]|uniref:TetR/AcrR family transcriptional regulator n=1 Tax=Actinomadura darangshiensis TaxID=705336 RepID=A0A4R5AG11_9ACTN|nr:TetR/AcrR family transcriptional regulator [Actinomadura darangshiensis]TDD70296.1 TetR/AcrR family transcriptional regulator [Actinomadura darangshiensis]